MEGENDGLLHDKLYYQLLGVRYISENTYEGDAKDTIADCITKHYYGGNKNGPGPRCSCEVGNAGFKCYDDKCSMAADNIECGIDCGEDCLNRTIRDGKYEHELEIQARDYYGKALVTKNAIKENEPVVEYIGKVKEGTVAFGRLFCYPLRRFEGTVKAFIDQEEEANETRWVCHSATPNCRIEEWIVGDQLRLVLMSNTKIAPENVLTVKYPQRFCQSEYTESLV